MLPELAMQTPAAFHYPVVFLATLIGNFYTGLASTLICFFYTLFFIRPHLLHHPSQDPAGMTRMLMFLSTSILFLSLIALLERALKKEKSARAIRDEFISLVSHELRTPLTSIKLNLEILKNELSDNSKLSSMLSSIERQGNRQERLINAMIDLALIDSDQLILQKENADIAAVIKGAAQTAKNALGGEVEYNIFPAELEIDKKRIDEALYNIVHNSIKYSERKIAKISMREDSGFIVIDILNFSKGIAKKDLGLIFKRFGRPYDETQIQGLGIGLYLANHFVELHRGRIELMSNDEETVFSIYLPSLAKQG